MSSNAADGQETTLSLHEAVATNNQDLVRRLLESGASVNARDHENRTPIDFLVTSDTPNWFDGKLNFYCKVREEMECRVRIAKLLIAAGAEIKSPCHIPILTTIFHEAAACQDVAVVEALLQNGADIKARSMVMNNTALHWALFYYKGNLKLVQTLLEHGSDVNASNGANETPLQIAVSHDETICTVELIELLLKYGADVDRRNYLSHNASREYIYNKSTIYFDPKMLKLLVLGNNRQENRMSELHEASLFHRVDLVRKLLWEGADVDARDCFQRTSMFYAAIARATNEEDKQSTIKLLLEFGSEVNCQMSVYKTGSVDYEAFSKALTHDDAKLLDIFSRYMVKYYTLYKSPGGKLLKKVFLYYSRFYVYDSFVNLIRLNATQKKMTSDIQLLHEELRLMKETKVGASGITFYDLLDSSVLKRATYAKNKHIVEYFEAGKSRFPMYQGILEASLYEGFERLRLIEDATEVLCDIIVFPDSFLSYSIPFLEKILTSYCSETDLKRINLCEETERTKTIDNNTNVRAHT